VPDGEAPAEGFFDLHKALRELPSEPAGRVAPGMGRVGNDEERKQVQAIADKIKANPEILSEKSREGQKARLYQSRQDRMAKKDQQDDAEMVQPVVDRGVGFDFFGSLLGDSGQDGSTFVADKSEESHVGLSSAANMAADALSIAADAHVEILTRITAMLLKHAEKLDAIMDKLDVDDTEDDW